MGLSSRKAKYIFLHFDGVVLENILAPLVYSIVKKLGGIYSAEIENNIFAISQKDAAKFLIDKLKLKLTEKEVISLYYSEREKFEKKHEIKKAKGLIPFFERLKNLNFKVISYGGASKDYFLKNTKDIALYFDDEKYIQTRDFRPGLKEITRSIYQLNVDEVVFIDEESSVARVAKELCIPFIGMDSGHSFSFQKQEMEKLNIQHIVSSLEEINEELLENAMKKNTHIELRG